MIRASFLLLFVAAPVAAQELSYSDTPTETCLDSGTDPANCIGESASACMGTNAGSSTVGMGFCLSQELDFWDQRLNTAYRALLFAERAMDEEAKEFGGMAPPRVSALRDMQRAWIEYRDAACIYEYAQWSGGTGGGPANVACLMQMTAEQALELEDRLEDHQR